MATSIQARSLIEGAVSGLFSGQVVTQAVTWKRLSYLNSMLFNSFLSFMLIVVYHQVLFGGLIGAVESRGGRRIMR